MEDINAVCDYVIFRLKAEGNGELSHLKLQKLLYYIQSWHLAFYKKPLFEGKFQAWIHGPVNRRIYNRFKDTKYMYSSINISDMHQENIVEILSPDTKEHIDNVLEVYAGYSDTQLEKKTHSEQPWITARDGYETYQRCEEEIDEIQMGKYYAARL
ncbi:Panacea domain-containing protein [Pedobacter sp.]